MNNNQIAELATSWIYEAADNIRKKLRQPLAVKTKENRKDLVTNLDQETEQFFRDKINHEFPDDKIIGEEGMGETVDSLAGHVWIVDPIDGTTNFVLQRNHFAIMIAYFVEGVGQFGAIYNVLTDEMLTAKLDQGATLNGEQFTPPFKDAALKDGMMAANTALSLQNKFKIQDLIEESMGLRMYGSAGLETMAIIKGELVAYISPRLSPWDIAAGVIIAREVGIPYSGLDGSEIDYFNRNAILLAYPTAYTEIRKHFDANSDF